jgi:membrane-associated phospholipid phosphatase
MRICKLNCPKIILIFFAMSRSFHVIRDWKKVEFFFFFFFKPRVTAQFLVAWESFWACGALVLSWQGWNLEQTHVEATCFLRELMVLFPLTCDVNPNNDMCSNGFPNLHSKILYVFYMGFIFLKLIWSGYPVQRSCFPCLNLTKVNTDSNLTCLFLYATFKKYF